MRHTHVDALALRDLRLLAALLETRSVTRAGEAFGLSQPAASRAVARLRRALGDPLLVRGPGGHVLTPRAEAVVPLLEAARVGLDRLFAPAAFDPTTTTARFRVASTDYGAVTVVPDAARRIANAAPRAALDVEPWGPDTLRRLERGDLDAALYADADLPPGFRARELFRDDYALLFDPDRRSLSDLAELGPDVRRVVVLYPDGTRLLPDDPLASLGHAPEAIALTTPYFATLPDVVRGTDLVVALPRRVARRVAAGAGLACLPSPRLGVPFAYRLVWHVRAQADAAHRWFRGRIAGSKA
jgi:DNA-binding transcriptional LysR family regulator